MKTRRAGSALAPRAVRSLSWNWTSVLPGVDGGPAMGICPSPGYFLLSVVACRASRPGGSGPVSGLFPFFLLLSAEEAMLSNCGVGEDS